MTASSKVHDLLESAFARVPALRGVVAAIPQSGLVDLDDLHALAPEEFSQSPREWMHGQGGANPHVRQGVHGQALADRRGAMGYIGETVPSLAAPMFRQTANLGPDPSRE